MTENVLIKMLESLDELMRNINNERSMFGILEENYKSIQQNLLSMQKLIPVILDLIE